MLTRLLQLLEQDGGELGLIHLSDQLGAQPSAVAGMVETLIRKGRLVAQQPACGVCELCAAQPDCHMPTVRAKRYRVVSPDSLF
jgi:hypothetical protein